MSLREHVARLAFEMTKHVYSIRGDLNELIKVVEKLSKRVSELEKRGPGTRF